MSLASRAAASASSQRPLSMHAHSSTESTAPLAPRTPGARSSAEGLAQHPDRKLGLVQDPGRPADLARVAERSAGDPVQVGHDFGSSAERVRACPDPDPGLVSATGRPVLGRRRRRARGVQSVQGGTCLGAGFGEPGLVGDRGCHPGGVPREGRPPRGCLGGDGDECFERLGVPVRPQQRPADIQPGGDAQVRIGCQREHLARQFTYPVGLSGGEGEIGGGQQPPGLVPLAGAELGGAFQGACRRGGAAAALRLGCAVLEQ